MTLSIDTIIIADATTVDTAKTLLTTVWHLALQAFQLGTAISNGVGTNLSINALYAGPYSTLVSNVDFGAARLPYGQSGAGPKASSFTTFWNVRVCVQTQ